MRTRFVVRGLVQGVFFRATAHERCDVLRLQCELWNRADGAVECVAEGDARAIEELAKWLHRGPPHARVDAVERTEEA